MKKEVVLVITACLFLLSYVLDFLAGNVGLSITHPVQLTNFTFFAPYPMTSFAIAVRSIALMLSATLLLSIIDYQYFKKTAISLFLGFLAFIYGYQQLINGGNFTPLLWTIAITYAGVLMLLPSIVYLLLGIYYLLIPPQKVHEELKIETNSAEKSTSVLNP
jgi:hypothetical protein